MRYTQRIIRKRNGKKNEKKKKIEKKYIYFDL